MLKKLKTIAVSIMLAVALGTPAIAGAACNGVSEGVAEGANASVDNNKVDCDAKGDAGENAVKDLAVKIVNIFSIIVGVAAIIMILYGGFRYITSGGSSDKVGSAKNTLIYAIVGLIVVALAQVIVNFVLSSASDVSL